MAQLSQRERMRRENNETKTHTQTETRRASAETVKQPAEAKEKEKEDGQRGMLAGVLQQQTPTPFTHNFFIFTSSFGPKNRFLLQSI
jgi:hypothetical protein